MLVEKGEQRLKEAHQKAIHNKLKAYSMTAIEAKRQAALKLWVKQQQDAAVLHMTTPPRTVLIMPPRANALSAG